MRKLLIALCILAAAGQVVHAEQIKVEVTAYMEHKQNTASGVHPTINTVAVSHDLKRKLKWGQKIYIQDVGWRIVQDLMNARWKLRLDCWMPTKAECLKWGKRKKMATIK